MMAVGAVLWAKAGFPFSFEELTSLFGTKPWYLDKDSYFFSMGLGAVIAVYCVIELNLKRWESKQK